MVSSITFVRYIFQFCKDGLFDSDTEAPSDWVKKVELGVAYLADRVRQAIAGTIQLAMDRDAAEIQLISEHDAGERD
jgi:hypothetical protein